MFNVSDFLRRSQQFSLTSFCLVLDKQLATREQLSLIPGPTCEERRGQDVFEVAPREWEMFCSLVLSADNYPYEDWSQAKKGMFKALLEELRPLSVLALLEKI